MGEVLLLFLAAIVLLSEGTKCQMYNFSSFTLTRTSDFEFELLCHNATFSCDEISRMSADSDLKIYPLPTFTVRRCQLPTDLLDCVFKALGWRKEKDIKLIEMFLSTDRQNPLAGVPLDVKDLKILNTDIATIPETLFQRFEGLRVITLEQNSLESVSENAFSTNSNLSDITICKNNLRELPTHLLSGNSYIQHVNISENLNSLQLKHHCLSNLTLLHRLFLINCIIKSVPGDMLVGSNNLIVVSLANNRLTDLPTELFRDQVLLKVLDLSHNMFYTVQPGLFKSLKVLQSLTLAYNSITSVTADMLQGLNSLETLNLSNNNITEVIYHAFIKRNLLMELNLDENHLQLFNSYLFASNSKLKKLSINSNHLKEINMRILPRSIEELSVSGNKLSNLQNVRVFNNVRRLDLSRNSFTDAFLSKSCESLLFSNSQNLVTFNLANNQLTKINDTCIRSWNLKGDFDFRNNQIRNIYDIVESVNNSVSIKRDISKRVLVEGNPFSCDCQMIHFLTYLNTHYFQESQIYVPGDSKCSSPITLKGRLLHEINPDELICKVSPPECPNKCTCTLRPARNIFLELYCKEVPQIHKYNQLQNKSIMLQLLHTPISSIILPHEIRELRLSGLNLTKAPYLPSLFGLSMIDLSNNSLTQVPLTILEMGNITTRLGKNPFICECEFIDDIVKLHSYRDRVSDFDSLQCLDGKPMSNAVNLVCSTNNIISILSAVSLLASLTALTSVLYYRYNTELKVFLYARNWCLWWVTEDELDREKVYDAFVTFSHSDISFVLDELVPRLEQSPHALRLCLHYRDWVAGEWITTEVERSVRQSRRTVVLLSDHYLKSQWTRHEFRTAHASALLEGRVRVVIVLLDDNVLKSANLDLDLLAYIHTNTYLRRDDPQFWERLRYALRSMQHSSSSID